jgi:hypothetical protein
LNWTPPLKIAPSIILDTVNELAVAAAVAVVVELAVGVTPPFAVPTAPVTVVVVVWVPEPVTVTRSVPRL